MTTKDFGEFVRTATRPLLTFTGLFAWIVFIADEREFPAMFQYLVVAMCIWWFGERSLRHFTDLMKNGK